MEKKNRESINTENLIVEDDISDDSNRSELKMSHDEEYEDNKNKMNKLDFEYTIFSIILMLTKFYWVCLETFTICSLFVHNSFIIRWYIKTISNGEDSPNNQMYFFIILAR